MKYVPALEAVNSALNFDTPDCVVTGGCDMYTTKATCTDKKLFKTIDHDLSSKHAELVSMVDQLTEAERNELLATSPNLDASAFGPLSQQPNRRTFAYLVATLNASHPHYDFSHTVPPSEFKSEKLRRVMPNLDSILLNVRSAAARGADAALQGEEGKVWGPSCWALIDEAMNLKNCAVFSWNPQTDPFTEDRPAIWAAHYFLVSRELKRVAYLYVRVVPVISSQSPTLRPSGLGVKKRRWAGSSETEDGSSKRARYWLGDRSGELVENWDEDEEGDGYYWYRADSGELDFGEDYEEYDDYEGTDLGETEEDDEEDDNRSKGGERGMSEDIVAGLEL